MGFLKQQQSFLNNNHKSSGLFRRFWCNGF